MLAGGEWVPDPRECLPEDGMPSDDSSPALLYMRVGGEMLAPSGGVYGRAGEGAENEGEEYEYSPMLVLRFKVLNPMGEPDEGTINRMSVNCLVEKNGRDLQPTEMPKAGES
jgi:hypothetical protein